MSSLTYEQKVRLVPPGWHYIKGGWFHPTFGWKAHTVDQVVAMPIVRQPNDMERLTFDNARLADRVQDLEGRLSMVRRGSSRA